MLAVNHGKATPSSAGAMALLQACLLLPPTLLATTFHRIETIPFDREVEKGLVSEEDDKGGEADMGFFLPYRKFTDIPGCALTFLFVHPFGSLQEPQREILPNQANLDGLQGKAARHMSRQQNISRTQNNTWQHMKRPQNICQLQLMSQL